MHPEAGSQGANALWLGQPHHPEETAAPPHTCKVSQWRRASPPHPEGEREVLAQPLISLIGNGGISGAWPIGIWPQHLFPLVQPKSGHFLLHLSPSEQVYQGRRDQQQEPPASAAPRRESPGWRSGDHPNTRPTGAYPWAFSLPVRLLSRLTWLQLRPLGQWCPNQVGALLDLASLDKQPMEVAPSFYPEGELWEAIRAEASSLLELLGDICHASARPPAS